MISYCVACYRPVYARQLIDDLIDKTAVAFEILLWINVRWGIRISVPGVRCQPTAIAAIR